MRASVNRLTTFRAFSLCCLMGLELAAMRPVPHSTLIRPLRALRTQVAPDHQRRAVRPLPTLLGVQHLRPSLGGSSDTSEPSPSGSLPSTGQWGCYTALAGSSPAQGVSGPSSSCVWNPRVFADDARGWQCPFVLCLHPQGCLRRGVRVPLGTVACC